MNHPCHQATCLLFQCEDPSWCEQYQKQCQHEECINISRCEKAYLCQDYKPISDIKPLEQIVIHRHSDLSQQEHNLLQQTSLKADFLLKKKQKPKVISKYD